MARALVVQVLLVDRQRVLVSDLAAEVAQEQALETLAVMAVQALEQLAVGEVILALQDQQARAEIPAHLATERQEVQQVTPVALEHLGVQGILALQALVRLVEAQAILVMQVLPALLVILVLQALAQQPVRHAPTAPVWADGPSAAIVEGSVPP